LATLLFHPCSRSVVDLPRPTFGNAMYTPADVLAILGFSCVVAILVGFSFWRIGERR
jgi:hypothetical protein